MTNTTFDAWRLFPITIEKLHENHLDCLIIEGVMLDDFGPWKQGARQCLTFDLIGGRVVEYGVDGNEVHVAMLRLLEIEVDRSDLPQ